MTKETESLYSEDHKIVLEETNELCMWTGRYVRYVNTNIPN